MSSDPVRWGIIGTAGIARGQFLPGVRAAGGIPAAVAGRDLGRAQAWAEQHGVDRAVEDMNWARQEYDLVVTRAGLVRELAEMARPVD